MNKLTGASAILSERWEDVCALRAPAVSKGRQKSSCWLR
jgi:hypothetical protein